MHRDLNAPPAWPALAAIVLGLVLLVMASCASRDDGMSETWRGVKHCNNGGCDAPRP